MPVSTRLLELADRAIAVSTVSANESSDSFNILSWLMTTIVRLLIPAAYQCMRSIARVFQDEAQDLDWTVFRIGVIMGGHDESSWRKGRENATHAGYVGDPFWKIWTNRSGLARWLVDVIEDGQGQWVGKSPAVSHLSGGHKKSS